MKLAIDHVFIGVEQETTKEIEMNIEQETSKEIESVS